MRVFSSGWGVDSTAVLILQIMGRIESYDHFIFANVGEDSENPDTIAYIKNVITPVAASRGISLVEVRAPGSSLYERLMGEQKSVVIPAYTRRSGGKLHRNCTTDYKIIPVQNWIKERASEATIGLGIAVDEIERMRSVAWYEENGLKLRREYPLIDLRLSRMDCLNLIADFGLPEPPPSRCTYCPFNSVNTWNRQYEQGGEIWEKSLRVDRRIRGKDSAVQGRAYLHRYAIPLERAVAVQLAFDYEASDDCDASCGT